MEPGCTNCTSAVALVVTDDPSSARPEAVTVSGKYWISLGRASVASGTNAKNVHSMLEPAGGKLSASGGPLRLARTVREPNRYRKFRGLDRR